MLQFMLSAIFYWELVPWLLLFFFQTLYVTLIASMVSFDPVKY